VCAQVSTQDRTQNSSIPDWWESVDVDHRNRKQRLQRQASDPAMPAPTLHEYVIPRADLPGLPGDMPVLRVVFQDRVFFDTAKWDIRPDALPVIDAVARMLREERSDAALFIAGHTDSRGTDGYNLDLSIKRATSVGEALLRRGIGLAKIWRIGFGEAVPLRPNNSDANMAANRRVEFVFASKPAAVVAWLGRQMHELCRDAALAAHCVRFARDRARYTALPVSLSSSPGTHVVGGPSFVVGGGVTLLGRTVIVGGAPFAFIDGPDVIDRRRLRGVSSLNGIDIGGRHFYPSGYVSIGQAACHGLTDNGCALNWLAVPTVDGASESACVAYCPTQITSYPAAVGTPGTSGTTILVGGASYPIVYGPHAVYRRDRAWKFNPASALSAILSGTHSFYPTGYVAIDPGLCRGPAGNGCLLNWQNVAAIDGGLLAQCVAYCPQRSAVDLVLPRTFDATGGDGGECEVVTYSAADLTGTSLRTGRDFPALSEWNKQIASLRVVSGTWSFFASDGYTGDGLRLAPGEYRHLNNWSNQISSFRCETRGMR
jgi:outer membrane protein OmpA-like peptidoglycan-associated protein